eukprot:1185924-Prorocentrum_minimum.AAC.2
MLVKKRVRQVPTCLPACLRLQGERVLEHIVFALVREDHVVQAAGGCIVNGAELVFLDVENRSHGVHDVGAIVQRALQDTSLQHLLEVLRGALGELVVGEVVVASEVGRGHACEREWLTSPSVHLLKPCAILGERVCVPALPIHTLAGLVTTMLVIPIGALQLRMAPARGIRHGVLGRHLQYQQAMPAVQRSHRGKPHLRALHTQSGKRDAIPQWRQGRRRNGEPGRVIWNVGGEEGLASQPLQCPLSGCRPQASACSRTS